MNIQRLRFISNQFQYHIFRSYGGSPHESGKQFIDLRSDTVTKPCEEMLMAMVKANVGDDVYKEDRTVIELEKTCADLFGMESALFVPSGTMANLVAIMTHVQKRGEEIIIGDNQHACLREQGNLIQFASIPTRVIPNKPDGTLCLNYIASKIEDGSDFHKCKTKLICLENTHMRCGGIPLTSHYTKQVGLLARSEGIGVHVDGARLYNAAVSQNCAVSDLLTHVDSVAMCLSKGIGCPVGSVIGGSKEFIEEAMRTRKSVGGGMRQAGYLAAAGLFGLQRAFNVLSADHDRAKQLAVGIKNLKCENVIDVDFKYVQTNILLIRSKSNKAPEIFRTLKEHGVLCLLYDPSKIRFVLHKDVKDSDVRKVLDTIKYAVEQIESGKM